MGIKVQQLSLTVNPPSELTPAKLVLPRFPIVFSIVTLISWFSVETISQQFTCSPILVSTRTSITLQLNKQTGRTCLSCIPPLNRRRISQMIDNSSPLPFWRLYVCHLPLNPASRVDRMVSFIRH